MHPTFGLVSLNFTEKSQLPAMQQSFHVWQVTEGRQLVARAEHCPSSSAVFCAGEQLLTAGNDACKPRLSSLVCKATVHKAPHVHSDLCRSAAPPLHTLPSSRAPILP
jgi:hypothetical protein